MLTIKTHTRTFFASVRGCFFSPPGPHYYSAAGSGRCCAAGVFPTSLRRRSAAWTFFKLRHKQGMTLGLNSRFLSCQPVRWIDICSSLAFSAHGISFGVWSPNPWPHQMVHPSQPLYIPLPAVLAFHFQREKNHGSVFLPPGTEAREKLTICKKARLRWDANP